MILLQLLLMIQSVMLGVTYDAVLKLYTVQYTDCFNL